MRNLFEHRFLTYTVVLGVALTAVLATDRQALAQTWNEEKSRHFIVYYGPASDRTAALKVLRRAEEYYNKIGNQIGYTRYHNFWTFNERVRIVMFPNVESFTQTTGQPPWLLGFSARDSHVFSSRSIVTYKQESGFFEGVLPHEISHLILHDFINSAHIPVWFDEGVAQLQEADKSPVARQMMRVLVSRGQFIPLGALHQWNIRQEEDPQKIAVFYAQSLSVVEFLIKNYGSYAFSRLCREMHDGKTFTQALHAAYTNKIDTLDELQDKWINYVSP